MSHPFTKPALLFSLMSLGGCRDDGECDAIAEGDGRVVVGFWDNDDCSGDPIITNSFPVLSDAPCYCWPGNSGENSADTYACDPDNDAFTYVQYNSLDCGSGDDSPTSKTVYSTTCTEDIPPTLHAMIIDYAACE